MSYWIVCWGYERFNVKLTWVFSFSLTLILHLWRMTAYTNPLFGDFREILRSLFLFSSEFLKLFSTSHTLPCYVLIQFNTLNSETYFENVNWLSKSFLVSYSTFDDVSVNKFVFKNRRTLFHNLQICLPAEWCRLAILISLRVVGKRKQYSVLLLLKFVLIQSKPVLLLCIFIRKVSLFRRLFIANGKYFVLPVSYRRANSSFAASARKYIFLHKRVCRMRRRLSQADED